METTITGKFVFFENNKIMREQGGKLPSFIVLDTKEGQVKIACWLPQYHAQSNQVLTLQVEEKMFKGQKSYTLITVDDKKKQAAIEIEHQKMIQYARLNCLKSALDYYHLENKVRPTIKELIDLSKQFEQYITSDSH